MTEVVNLRFQEYDVYIGRAGHGKDGYHGNPIVKGQECLVCGNVHTTPGETLDCFRIYFAIRLEDDEEFRRRTLSLMGKRLGCFCKPRPCHGDVIVEWVNSQERTCLETI